MSDLYNTRETVLEYLVMCGLLIKMSTKAVINDQVKSEYIVIHEAPPRAVSEIVTKFKHVSLTAEGMLIPLEI